MKQLFIFLLLASLYSHAQQIDLGDYNTLKKVHYHEAAHELFIFKSDTLAIIDLNSPMEIKETFLQYPYENFIIEFYPISVGETIYFIELNGGKLFKLEGHQIVRKDNSFTHKMQINASNFVYRDTIYRYGGYGFWSHRNFFTYYDLPSSEWQIVSPSNSQILPEGTQSATVVANDGSFYVFGGITSDPFKPTEFYHSDKVYKYKKIDAYWTALGTSNVNLSKFAGDISFGNKRIFLNNYDNNLYVVDVIENSLKIFQKTSRQQGISTFLPTFYAKGKFYCFNLIQNQKIDLKLIVIPEEEFFGTLVRQGEFYNEGNTSYMVFWGLFIVGVTALLFYPIRTLYLARNKIKVTTNGLFYKNSKIDMDEKDIAAINLLLRSEEEVNSSELMDLIENKNQNFAHNTKVKNKLIEEINFKLKTVLGIKVDPIAYQKSKIDKRIKTYTIERKYFLLR